MATRRNPSRRLYARRLSAELLEDRTLLDAAGWFGSVVHDSDGDLFAVDLLGDMAIEHLGQADQVMFDMAFSPSGELYGVGGPPEGPSELYLLDVDLENPTPETLIESTLIGTVSSSSGGNLFINALQFREDGILLGAGFDSLFDEFLYSIDLETGNATEEVDLGDHQSAGDLALDTDGNAYLTTFAGQLLRIDGVASTVDVVGSIDAGDFYGLTYGPAPVMYGFRWLGEVWKINPTDAGHTLETLLQDPLLFGIYGAATLFEPPTDLGQVDFRQLRNQQPILGQLWYRLDAMYDGLLTAEAPGMAAESGVEMTLYTQDAAGQLHEMATGQTRLDYDSAVAGEQYFLQVSGADAGSDVRVTNLVSPVEDGLIVYGHDGNDLFELQLGEPTIVTINDVQYEFNFEGAGNTTISFLGGAGNNGALVTATDGDDGVAMEPYSAVLVGPWYEVDISDTYQIGIWGGGGDDSAVLFGTDGSDEATLWPDSAELAADNYALYVVDFSSVELHAFDGEDTATFGGEGDTETVELWVDHAVFSGSSFAIEAWDFESTTAIYFGGSNTAIFHDSPGDDRFEVSPGSATLSGPGFSLTTFDYNTVEADGSAGGHDVADLTDSAGDDVFLGQTKYGKLSGGGFSSEVSDFEEIIVRSAAENDDHDEATINDSVADDAFVGAPDLSSLSGGGASVTINNFEQVIAYADAGGNDTVSLSDSVGDDLYVTTAIYGGISGDGFAIHTQGFDTVEASATAGGEDLAKMFDSRGDDYFWANPTEAELSGDTYLRRAGTFEAVHAYATAGGDDRADFFDSEGNEIFWGRSVDGGIIGDEFFARAKHFENIHHYSDTGGFDIAKFFDSPGDDLFVATPPLGTLSYGDLSGGVQHQHAHNFEQVHAYGTAGGHDVANLYDSEADDLFYGDPIQGALFDPGQYYNRAKFFEEVHGFGINGGRDHAELFGSAGDDTFVASPAESTLSGPAPYSHRVISFEEVFADAGAGGHDEADLSDSPSPDLLLAQGNWARLSNATLDFLFEAGAFDFVKATASSAGDIKSVVEPLDFLLDLEGPWQDA